jgi:hypothetical protein
MKVISGVMQLMSMGALGTRAKCDREYAKEVRLWRCVACWLEALLARSRYRVLKSGYEYGS